MMWGEWGAVPDDGGGVPPPDHLGSAWLFETLLSQTGKAAEAFGRLSKPLSLFEGFSLHAKWWQPIFKSESCFCLHKSSMVTITHVAHTEAKTLSFFKSADETSVFV